MAIADGDPDFQWAGKTNEGLAHTLRGFDSNLRRGTKLDFNGISEIFPRTEYYPPCMKRLVGAANKGIDLGHAERLEMGKFMMHVHAGDIDKVSPFYSKMSDFNEGITEYQLQYIKDTGQKMTRCDKLQDLGICEFEREKMCTECPFYPSINIIIKRGSKIPQRAK